MLNRKLSRTTTVSPTAPNRIPSKEQTKKVLETEGAEAANGGKKLGEISRSRTSKTSATAQQLTRLGRRQQSIMPKSRLYIRTEKSTKPLAMKSSPKWPYKN
jgi:hypothetical protein